MQSVQANHILCQTRQRKSWLDLLTEVRVDLRYAFLLDDPLELWACCNNRSRSYHTHAFNSRKLYALLKSCDLNTVYRPQHLVTWTAVLKAHSTLLSSYQGSK